MAAASTEKSPRSLRERPPLEKGADAERRSAPFPPLKKGGEGGFPASAEGKIRVARYRSDLKPLARDLRGHLTDAEQKLWHRLRRKQVHGVQFYRQKPLGKFIVDFYAPAVKLVVEVDGAQHLSDDGQNADARRDGNLASLGLTVLRFDNRQVLVETDAVLAVIERHVANMVGSSSGQTENPPCARNPPCPPFSKGGSE